MHNVNDFVMTFLCIQTLKKIAFIKFLASNFTPFFYFFSKASLHESILIIDKLYTFKSKFRSEFLTFK